MLHSTAEASRVRCDVCQTPYSPEVAQLGPSRSKRRIRWLASGCLRFFQHFFVLYPLIVVFTIQGLLGCLLFLQSCELGRPLDAMHILLWHIADMSFFRLFFTDLTYKNLVSVFKQRRGWVVELWGFPVCVVAIFLTVAMTAACLTLIKGVLWLQGMPWARGSPEVSDVFLVPVGLVLNLAIRRRHIREQLRQLRPHDVELV